MNQDQEKLLQDSKKIVKDHAYFMNRELENANLRGALKHASNMLSELKTQNLSPRNYYILFMAAFDQMRQLEKYFKQQFRRGRKMIDLYEAVQHAPQLIPRIYLLITVGSVYIQSHQQGSDKILEDLIEMLKAVQNPLRGLFIRYYFLKMCKDRLPDTGSEYQSEGRGIQQAIEIIFTNLKQSVFLWIRLNVGKDKSRKQKDRMDLKVLIGQGLHRISSLEGVNLQIYKNIVLNKLLELIKTSKDSIAQQYLIDCMIQGFPQQFHINTLPQILGCSKDLQKQVDTKLIFISLMDRLSDYAASANSTVLDIKQTINIYELFKQHINDLVIKSDPGQFKNVLNLLSAFLKFTVKCYPTQSQYVNQILKIAVQISSKNENNIDQQCQTYVVKFLTLPIQTLSIAILSMDQYPNLMKYLKFSKRREVAYQIVKVVTKLGMPLVQDTLVAQLLNFIRPLLISENDYEQISETLFKDQQNNVCKLLYLINSQDPAVIWTIIKLFIEKFKDGGVKRIKFTYPAILFKLFNLAYEIKKNNPQSEGKVFKKIFELSRNLITQLSQHQPKLCIKLYLQFILVINELDKNKLFDQFTYEVTSQALLLYQSKITEPELKIQFLKMIIGTLGLIQCVSSQNYDTLITNVVTFCSKLLKKNQQCSLLLNSTHLFYSRSTNEQGRIFEILKKCAKLANTCVGQSIKNLYLFIQLINKYAYFSLVYGINTQQLQTILNVFLEKLQQFKKQSDPICIKHISFWNQTREFLIFKIQQGKLELTFD